MELPVRVTILGEKPVSFESAMVTLDRRSLSVRSAQPLALRTSLKVEAADQLWLGEVIEIRRDGHSWLAEARILHALRDLADLRRLNRRFLGQPEPEERPAPSAKSRVVIEP